MSNEQMPPPPPTAEIVRQSDRALLPDGEIGVSAAVARARAEVEAPYTIARHFPRVWLDVRDKLIGPKGALQRPGFAKASLYAKEQGNKEDPPGSGNWVPNIVEGLSIRFADAAMQIAGNMRAGSEPVFDDDSKRIYRVFVYDLESNAIQEASVTVEKTVERRGAGANGRDIIRERVNKGGKPVFICVATEEEVKQKANNGISKERRNLILALLPPDLKEEAFALAKANRAKDVAADPHAEEKALADGFAKLNVKPSDLAEYLGHELAQCSPAELDFLRGIFTALTDGEIVWADLVAEKAAPADKQPKTSKARGLAEKLKRNREANAKK